jgi:S1-C subfamily serine protease
MLPKAMSDAPAIPYEVTARDRQGLPAKQAVSSASANEPLGLARSLGERLGLQGGDRPATIDGQQLVLGGDIILAAHGIEIRTIEDLIRAALTIRDQPPDREVRMRVLRGGKVVNLATIWSGAEGSSSPR